MGSSTLFHNFLLLLSICATLANGRGQNMDTKATCSKAGHQLAPVPIQLLGDENCNTTDTDVEQSYPIVDKKPLMNMVKAVGNQYSTIILDCLPVVITQDSPPHFAEIFLHFPEQVAKLNRKKSSKEPLQIWIHPHLHIPYLRMSYRDENRFISNPIDMAFYMVRQANFVYSDTVVGLMSMATPLLIFDYRVRMPTFRRMLEVRNLKLGLMIENWEICELMSKQHHLQQMLIFFDEFYFHQPRIIDASEKESKDVFQDAVKEGQEFAWLFEECKEAITRHLPEGSVIKPVRGYIKAKFNNNLRDEAQMRFSVDVVRL